MAPIYNIILYLGPISTVRPRGRSRILLCVCAYYYIELQTAVLNITRRSRNALNEFLFSPPTRPYPILHPTHTFTRRRRQSFVNRPGYPDVFFSLKDL